MITPTTPLSDLSAGSRTVADYGAYDRPFARISWGSIFAGAIIALAAQLVLALIGTAIGLATLDPMTGDNPSAASLGMGAGIWLILSSLLSLFFGGYIAARLGGTFNGWLHGLTTWGTVTMLTVMLLTSAAGRLVGTASGLANFVANKSDKAQLQSAASNASAKARQKADELQAAAQQPGEQPIERDAKVTANRAAKGGAVGTGAAAFGLILGALAAAFGGKTGQQHSWRRNDREETETGHVPVRS
ncbi:MAG: hypothetical protein ABI871_05895 [Chthoniobacterales bacterium]